MLAYALSAMVGRKVCIMDMVITTYNLKTRCLVKGLQVENSIVLCDFFKTKRVSHILWILNTFFNMQLMVVDGVFKVYESFFLLF